jgi:glyoxylase-like metal-dependent hydrolase (beta-lactamase superfamily II)
MRPSSSLVLFAAVAALALPGPAHARQGMDSVQIRTVPLNHGVYMLVGAGGNIALASGDDAAFIVDDQFAPLTPKILAAIRAITDKPVRFMVNTHWHFDHTGGNENFGKAGTVIVAHDNVRKRMSVEQFISRLNRREAPSPKAALPSITFPDQVTFHLNGDTIHAVHVPPAHTDGDAIVHWSAANVLHMGDVFFNGRYPFIDLDSGGSFEGVINAVNSALAMSNDQTKIIPGHGELATKADLLRYRDVMVQVRDRVRTLIQQGKTKDEVIAAKPTAQWDATWGAGFMNPATFLGIVYDSMKR